MKQESLAKWLKGVILAVAVCGLILCLYVLPVWGKLIIEQELKVTGGFLSWCILLWLSALPVFGILFLGWRVASEIGRDNSFSESNAVSLKYVSVLSLVSSLIFFGGNILFLVQGINRLGILFLSCLLVFVGLAVSVAAALISHLVYKAARMQEENQLTI
ncbi:MAG: DUF2975 domain-containing protein [Lachnospiraceae bacterium]|nr:DUF2975 domain-containing protein [Lachnospiraceae bacterium]